MVTTPRWRSGHDLPLLIMATAAIGETVWTIFLGLRLPPRYDANHWDLAWVGIDAAQVLLLLGAAWSALRQRAVLILFASASGTLLLVDGWFDVTTARPGDFDTSLLVSLIGNVPFAFVLFWITRRTIKRLMNLRNEGPGLDSVALRRIPLPPQSTRPRQS